MPELTPKVAEIQLRKHYRFMYENFVIATQGGIYLLLERTDDAVDVIYFDSARMKYGSPNDEARGGHPLWRYGLGIYGFFEVINSPWIREQMIANRLHEKHSDSLFNRDRHFIACFKDVMLEVTCHSFEERTMTVTEIGDLLQRQLANLAD